MYRTGRPVPASGCGGLRAPSRRPLPASCRRARQRAGRSRAPPRRAPPIRRPPCTACSPASSGRAGRTTRTSSPWPRPCSSTATQTASTATRGWSCPTVTWPSALPSTTGGLTDSLASSRPSNGSASQKRCRPSDSCRPPGQGPAGAGRIMALTAPTAPTLWGISCTTSLATYARRRPWSCRASRTLRAGRVPLPRGGGSRQTPSFTATATTTRRCA